MEIIKLVMITKGNEEELWWETKLKEKEMFSQLKQMKEEDGDKGGGISRRLTVRGKRWTKKKGLGSTCLAHEGA